MVFTLQRYIFRELFKVFALATVGLTLILSLGGILQPVQEYGVGPRQVLHILLYFMPITLTFVLPMAALFASALTYGRFASDNELDACRASGISLLTMVYPGLVLAILVAIANLLLSFHVMPYFVHLAERSLKADAKQILFRNIQRRGFFSLPPEKRFMIYADYVDPGSDTLAGIVVIQRDEGTVKNIQTADVARVHFDPNDKFNEVRLDVYGARQMGEAGDYWITLGAAQARFAFGSLLGDDIKFKQVDEIKRIRADLMQFDPVSKLARAAFSQLATEVLAQDISERLAAPQRDLYELRGTVRSVRFAATSCALEAESRIDLLGPVRVEEYDSLSGKHLRTFHCQTVAIHVDEDTRGPGLGLYLNRATHAFL
ncbi:MAG: LptF/LptG family permease [Planctomycetota bacterium]|jgi:lipopolysaccharide export LptBFGC system permease protein LptF